jgi:hypothetical protein
MSTSGVTTWSLQRDAVINSALRKLGVLAGGSSPEVYQTTQAAEALNGMIKAFQADGMPVWAIKSTTFSAAVSQSLYSIGIGQSLNVPMPLKIIEAYRREGAGTQVRMNIYTSYDFNVLPSNATGTPIAVYYQPFSTFGQINIWPTTNTAGTDITVRYQRPFEDMVSATDDLDFPSYWTDAVIYGLAWRLAPEYGIPAAERATIQKEALFFKTEALSFGTEEGSLFIMPDRVGK